MVGEKLLMKAPRAITESIPSHAIVSNLLSTNSQPIQNKSTHLEGRLGKMSSMARNLEDCDDSS